MSTGGIIKMLETHEPDAHPCDSLRGGANELTNIFNSDACTRLLMKLAAEDHDILEHIRDVNTHILSILTAIGNAPYQDLRSRRRITGFN